MKLAAVSRSGYYKWRKSRQATSERRQKEHELESHLLAIHRVHPYFGYLRITIALRTEGLRVTQKGVPISETIRHLLCHSKETSILWKTSFCGEPESARAPVSGGYARTKLVTDITYIRAGEHFVYLSVVQDLYNNEIVAWHLSERNDLALVHDTLDIRRSCLI
ncbi:DDE-type integrase/transposase/recombinase [Paenibacillus sp. ClWae2A]|uniref:DDE-type integrase/transposase/recombinase n=1 Tax=Paenibacillus sp. ClWae2A TaxID=3057177 RepID=UPI0037C67B3B